jgi:hypothetical protein
MSRVFTNVARWPAVPTTVDWARRRFFRAEFQRRVANDRLGLDADEIPDGHLVAMGDPSGLADMLVAYAARLYASIRNRDRTRAPADPHVLTNYSMVGARVPRDVERAEGRRQLTTS